ncbi:alpha-D-ribose 1-methylphosphonate 5-triphosphate diphosphatase [Vagococcus penaei]|uniref:Alpha-D-ribose 1-methylphosphonate 5-triphosphate diphosphatase n=1 Tax=Vagococcus penaei TaxID=633807 RepID=A0A1Q2D7F0_9ENTE|nr:alpha-D-ribose 1-methylphosphonate 5-triphosphate diphosphatase [Vagococcus penaei]AQP54203.1 alpha-D-ribose 1-methylphosphonate 5-triphosphate diphosphatase [Vagococcus penaei]RST99987.1 alpha-D-ribose 1-methylphosphonate 5-triphosphate diphosphatase [Vagococcus penaei]
MQAITNAHIVLPNHVIVNHSLIIDGELIIAMVPDSELMTFPLEQIIDAKRGYVLPGFIDVHSDYIETIAAPRPTSLIDFEIALYEAERELLTHGITTMYHSLSLMGRSVFDEKPIRNSENVSKLLELIDASNNKSHLIHHRMHLRYEIDNFKQLDLVKQMIEEGKVQLLSFMDHTPGQGQYRDLEIYRHILHGYHDGDDEKVQKILDSQQDVTKLTLAQLKELADLAKAHQVPLASHDDDTMTKLDLMEGLNTTISEFPITIDVAVEARKRGLMTVGGAPNVLLGKSHAGNLSVKEAIQVGGIDVLCSDYYPASLLHAVFKLAREEVLTLPEAVQLVTLAPAKAVGIADEVGSLEPNKLADILIIQNVVPNVPVVTHTFVRGVLVNETTYRI